MKGKKTFRILTLGCKVNQYESMHVAEGLEKLGMEEGDEPEVVVVNTCTVTHRSDRDAKILIRRARRENPNAFLAVTGCLAQLSGEELLSLGADLVTGSALKGRLPELIAQGARGVLTGSSFPSGLGPEPVNRFSGRKRAFLKVQDGCEAFCSYCIVPHARGPSRSLPPEEVGRGLRALKESGHREVVLTGIHVGYWGKDLTPPLCFLNLLEIAEREGPGRIRISSIEPMELEDAVIAKIASSASLCPHLHIPLQSGSDEILQKMGRPYDSGAFLERVNAVLKKIPDLCLGFDVIVGFPGETEEHFEETHALLDSIPLAYLHVFPYSRREGTPAASMPGQVADGEKKRRAAVLRALSARKRGEFERKFVGRSFPAIAENVEEEGFFRLRTKNYLEVWVRGEEKLFSGEILVRIKEFRDNKLFGET